MSSLNSRTSAYFIKDLVRHLRSVMPFLGMMLWMTSSLVQGSEREKELEEDRLPTHAVQPLIQGKDKIWILSIDGGGIRGLIPAYILQYIEERAEHQLKERLHNRVTRDLGRNVAITLPFCPISFSHCFDIMAGTSTGGIITLGLNIPADGDMGPKALPRYRASDLVKLYQEYGQTIFSRPASTLKNLFSRKYSAEPIEQILDRYFGDTTLSQLITTGLVTTYELRQEQLLVMDSSKARVFPSEDFYVRESARCTSAAPTFFEAAKVNNLQGESYLCADGGLIANNPALIAYMRGQSLYPHAKRIMMLSLGTGESVEDRLSSLGESGLIGWAAPVASVMMKGVSDLNHRLLQQQADTLGETVFDYTRIQVPLTTKRAVMDDVSPDNLYYLLQLAKKEASSSQRLERFIHLLAEDLSEHYVFHPSLQQDVRQQLTENNSLFLKGHKGFTELTDLHAWDLVNTLKEYPGLETLRSEDLQLSPQGLSYLLRSIPTLTNLSLKKGHLIPSGLDLLLGSVSSLRLLDLEGNEDLSDAGIDLLTSEQLPHLSHLNLMRTKLTDQGAERLASCFPGLEALSIGQNPLTPKGVRFLLTNMRHLKHLDLSRSDGTYEVIAALQGRLDLLSLNLSHNRLDDKTFKYLIESLQGKSLQSLTVRYNTITAKSGSLLEQWLKETTTLTALDLDNNHLQDQGIKQILQGLVCNQSLEVLNLRRNFIGHEGIADLPLLLRQNSTLRSLDLRGNQSSLKEEGMDELKEASQIRRTFTLLYKNIDES